MLMAQLRDSQFWGDFEMHLINVLFDQESAS